MLAECSYTEGPRQEVAGELGRAQGPGRAIAGPGTGRDRLDAVANLQATYGYYVDKMRWDDAADLFASDATLEIAGRGLFEGQDRIRTYLHALGKLEYGTLFNHMQLQPVIHVAPDGQSATGTLAHVHAGGPPGQGSALGRSHLRKRIREGRRRPGRSASCTATSPSTWSSTRAGTRVGWRCPRNWGTSIRMRRQRSSTVRSPRCSFRPITTGIRSRENSLE